MKQYDYYQADGSLWRCGVRGGDFVFDKALTQIGFDGTEGVDWILVDILQA
ncbi:MAG: hypothetical protein WDA29_10375 [Flavobacteriaceae bacterium]|jgi:hypothetical protein